MKKILVIIRREYITRVRTKAFLIGTIATPLLMLALTLLPSFLATRGGGQRQVTVLDQSGDPTLFSVIEQRLRSRPADDDERQSAGSANSNSQPARDPSRTDTRYQVTQVVVPPDKNIDEVAAQYRDQVQADSSKAFVVLRPDIFTGGESLYYAKNVGDLGIRALERAISSAVTERRLVQQGFAVDRVTGAMKPVAMRTFKVSEEGVSEESGMSLFFVGLTMLIFIYTTILVYGLSVMRGVIEEKQSRIVEVVISSVRPTQMMLGKLIGIGLVGLTQYVIWVGAAALLLLFGASMAASSGFSLPRLPLSTGVYFIIYFVLGYFLYATLYAMVGAMVSSEEEAQQAQFPVTMLIIVPMMLFTMVMNNPNSPTSVALSMVPFFAPTLMMMRIAMTNPPLWQTVGSMLIMVVTILAAVWFAARIYRVGILMYGKRPSLAELGRWLRYS